MSDEISMDDAAGLLAGNDEPKEELREQADELLADEPEPAEPEGDVEEEYDAPDEDQPIEEEAEDDDPELPPIEPPASWSADEKEAFQALPYDKQQVIANRERARTAEIRRNQNEIAEKQKALEAERAALEQEREQYLSAIPQPTPPDEALLEEDPMEYLRQQRKYENDLNAHKQAQSELAKTHQQKQEQARLQYDTWLKGEQEKLAEILPEYMDEVKGPALKKQVAEYAIKNGYTPDQLSMAGASDVNLLYKAMQYDLGKKAAAKAKVAPVPKMQKPGTSKSKAEVSAKMREEAVRKLEKTGSIEDALRLMSR